MLEFVAFKPSHLAAIRLQAVQASAQPLMNAEHGAEIHSAPGRAFTALLDGLPVACAGVIQLWDGRGYAWAYLSDAALRHIKTIHRYACKALARMPWRRIEAAVDPNHPAGSRWLQHLGFKFEGIARAWTIDGRDVQQWARVCKL
jgi:RimJ/RimL family protein N-acetyltransferase